LLRVTFPTGLNPENVWVDAAFAVLSRPIDLPEAAGWVEDPTPLMHQRSFIELGEKGRGLAILNRGLPAVEVTRLPGGTQVGLVLLRCVGWLSRDDLTTRRVAAGPLPATPGAQCPGKFRFDYAILPHAGDWKDVVPMAYQYASPVLVRRADTHEGLDLHEMNITRDDPAKIKNIPWPRGGVLPDRFSFISTEDQNLVLSAVHLTEDGGGLVVRFYNLALDRIQGRIKTGFTLAEAWLTNMNEERQESLPLSNEHDFEASFGGRQVLTFELRFRALAAEAWRAAYDS
jgi:2-O-(6-phospho-alpha-D-mannosyl)-D-glycerate hydrolase